jgi:hypothetical protein
VLIPNPEAFEGRVASPGPVVQALPGRAGASGAGARLGAGHADCDVLGEAATRHPCGRSTKKLPTLGARIDFFDRVFDVPGKARAVIARRLEIVCSTRHDIAADPEPQNRRADRIMVMAAFAGVCSGDNKEVKIAVGPSRALIDHLLDPENGSATIENLQRAARIVGRELRLQLV